MDNPFFSFIVSIQQGSRFHAGFVDVWMVTQDVDLSDIKMQPDEVQNVMWASADKIKDMLAAGEFIPSIMTGFNMVCDYIEMLRH